MWPEAFYFSPFFWPLFHETMKTLKHLHNCFAACSYFHWAPQTGCQGNACNKAVNAGDYRDTCKKLKPHYRKYLSLLLSVFIPTSLSSQTESVSSDQVPSGSETQELQLKLWGSATFCWLAGWFAPLTPALRCYHALGSLLCLSPQLCSSHKTAGIVGECLWVLWSGVGNSVCDCGRRAPQPPWSSNLPHTACFSSEGLFL